MADDTSTVVDNPNSVYTDPDNMTKVEAQILMWDGEKWLEISNTRTTNQINDHVKQVEDAVAEAQKGIQTAVDTANSADSKADTAITNAGFATDTATTAKQVATESQTIANDAKTSAGTAMSNAQTALQQAQQALTTGNANSTDIDNISKDLSDAKTDLQGQITTNKNSIADTTNNLATVSKDLNTTKSNLQSVSDLATQNGKDINTTNSTVNGIKTDLANTKGDVTELKTTASGFSADMVNAKGDITSLKTRAGTLESNMSSVQGDVSILKQTTTGIQSDVKDTKGNITTLQQRANGFDTAIGTNNGDISTLKSRATTLESNMSTAQGNISSLQQTATSLSSDMTNAKGDISSLKQSATTMQSDIKDNADNIASVKLTANKLSSDMQSKVDTSVYTSDKTQTAKDIASKVSQTDFNALQGNVDTQGTTISQNSKDIALKANTTDVNTLTGRVSTAESNISQNAQVITQKVSANDVINMLTPYATQSYAQSAITQSANSINSTVSSLQNQVNNTQIGGSNLLLNSFSDWRTATSSGSGDWMLRTLGNNYPYNKDFAGKNFTVSVQIQNNNCPVTLEVYLLNSSGTRVGTAGSTQTIVNGKMIYSFVMPSSDTATQILLDVCRARAASDNTSSYQYRCGKLENGNVATDYSVADADLATITALSSVSQKADSISQTVTNNKASSDSQFSTINQTISGIQQTVSNKADSSAVTQLSDVSQKADSISQTVTNNKASSDSQFSTINQTISGIQQTVSNKADSSAVTQLSDVIQQKVSTIDYNSKITQLSNDINERVSKGDVVSQINQEAGGNTLIQVSNGTGKLYLDAASVVFGGNAFISDAMITNLSVDKLTGGYITTAGLHQYANGIDTWIDGNGFNQYGNGESTTIKNGVINTNVINAIDSLHIGNVDSDPRKVWGADINKQGFSVTVPVKIHGATTNNSSDYHTEVQGFIGGLGWDYAKSTATGTGRSGIMIGITAQGDWGAPYGGDYFQLGRYMPTENTKDINQGTVKNGMTYAVTANGNAHLGFTFADDIYSESHFYYSDNNNDALYVKNGDANLAANQNLYIIPGSGYNTKILSTVDVRNNLNVNSQLYVQGMHTDGGSWWAKNTNGFWFRNPNGSTNVLHAASFSQSSQLSLKTNISKLDSKEALATILQDDQYVYSYKADIASGRDKKYASFIIDDVHEESQYKTPQEFLSEDKTGRDDGTQLAYAIASIQELNSQIQDLKVQIAQSNK